MRKRYMKNIEPEFSNRDIIYNQICCCPKCRTIINPEFMIIDVAGYHNLKPYFRHRFFKLLQYLHHTKWYYIFTCVCTNCDNIYESDPFDATLDMVQKRRLNQYFLTMKHYVNRTDEITEEIMEEIISDDQVYY